MQSTAIFIILTYLIQFCWAGSEPLLHPHNLSKRYLVYPYGGTFKFILSIAIPIEIGSKQSLAYSINYQFQYPLPKNLSDFDMKWVTNLKERRKRRLINIPQQTIFYSSVEDALTR